MAGRFNFRAVFTGIQAVVPSKDQIVIVAPKVSGEFALDGTTPVVPHDSMLRIPVIYAPHIPTLPAEERDRITATLKIPLHDKLVTFESNPHLQTFEVGGLNIPEMKDIAPDYSRIGSEMLDDPPDKDCVATVIRCNKGKWSSRPGLRSAEATFPATLSGGNMTKRYDSEVVCRFDGVNSVTIVVQSFANKSDIQSFELKVPEGGTVYTAFINECSQRLCGDQDEDRDFAIHYGLLSQADRKALTGELNANGLPVPKIDRGTIYGSSPSCYPALFEPAN